MKIIRFSFLKKEYWGVAENDFVKFLDIPPFEKIRPRNKKISLSQIKLLPPSQPTKIILAGLNYIDHAKELNMKIPKEPLIFLKPPTALIGNEDNIFYPHGVSQLDFEGELAIIIKKEAKNIPQNKIDDYILGYTCLNDVTARDLQKLDGEWTRAKSFDTFCPVGPYIETEINPGNLNIRTFLNGRIKQDSNTSNFIFSVRELVSFITNIMTLLPGDIISTGTPPGVGPMNKSDIIEVEIEGIGKLKNKVI